MALRLNSTQKRAALVAVIALAVFGAWRLRVFFSSDYSQDAMQASIAAPRAEASARLELNAADTTALQALSGIGPTFARRIVRYRELIGGYTDPEQLMRVYGITPEAFLRIEPQVYADTHSVAFKTLRANRKTYAGKPAKRFQHSDFETQGPVQAPVQHASYTAPAPQEAPGSPKPIQLVNINTADSVTLLRVPGIGPSTAGRIIRFRDRLLFFKSLEQMAEVYGIRPENLERMLPHLTVGELAAYPRVHINEWDISHLGRHPYIGYRDAKILVAYRDLHGPFKSADDLRWVLGIDPKLAGRVEGYLQF